jgi:hypothetical protein
LSVGLKRVLIGKGTHFIPTNKELLEYLKEKSDQTNSMSYPFIDALIPMSMVSRISFALSFLFLRCVLMQPHLSSVVLCLLLHSMVGSKTLFLVFTRLVGKDVQPLQSEKLTS